VSKPPANPRVAIVHDWLIGGGAERVVQALHDMYPDAPIYTSYCTPEWRDRLDGKVVTGYLQHWPFAGLRKFVGVLRIWWFSSLDLSGYDLVISSSGNGEAFGVRVKPGTTHICYCHTPTHYYWRHYDQYLSQPGFGVFNPLARLALKLLVGPLRKWDYRAAQRPDYFIANSTHIQSDIAQYYNRKAEVIHPPIDIARFETAAANTNRHGFVTAGRQVPAKRTDLIVQAATKLNVPLTVIGRGPEHAHLKKMAGSSVTFRDDVSDAEMPALLAAAEAFVFASYDDFGIVPIEAMAAGTPVIAFRAGGALDYIVPGKTGEFFDEQTVPSLRHALRTFDPGHYKSSTVKHAAAEFSPEVFRSKMRQFIDTVSVNR
jgi:glycosyltransferase involved in cell wall biosynthesis